ncbi:uncharacterized protein TRAVEDRAFT_59667 [Trametes versicolor FP-101664 SS1]|uniref:uncharacterized protein n=1 Tax=Trametes versicolor (strain FP-101664) TaxID=717944 RepID=UPI0004621853|nr:uncharacterized protein TRAVEDRAFT_59667 [Trametes versicolor FP-101664 SS1]EIW56726.1 hypothetical protein TRAVEDRAFT_59667 [Trametes versicolor FP-101664 SS1]
MAHVSRAPQLSVYTTLHDEDILDCLFDTLESRSKGLGRRTLASCALVCKSWSDPASRALWRRLDSFHPLWALLAGRNFQPSAKRLTEFWQVVEPEVFVKQIHVKEPDLWDHFLRRASYVREIGTASCREPELALMCAVIQQNGGRTFLPTLQKLVWRNGIHSDTSLRFLVSSSLRGLELDVTTFTSTITSGGLEHAFTAPIIDQTYPAMLFAGLPKAAPNLQRLVITGRQLSSLDVIPNILGFERMRELSLFREVLVTPGAFQSILTAMPALELLNVRLQDFTSPLGMAYSPSLRVLSIHGAARYITGLFTSFFDAPSLDSVSLNVEDEAYSADHPRCLHALSKTSFAPSLRELRLRTLVQQDPDQPPSLADTMEHLAELRALEVAELHLQDTWTRIDDDDIRAIARAWPRLQRLQLAYIPSNNLPPLIALRHFAQHCPELRYLYITKMGVPTVTEEATSELEGSGAGIKPGDHPMRTLDMRMTFAGMGSYDVAGIARFIDGLFPNLELNAADANGNAFAVMAGVWNSIEREIRKLRTQKGSQG